MSYATRDQASTSPTRHNINHHQGDALPPPTVNSAPPSVPPASDTASSSISSGTLDVRPDLHNLPHGLGWVGHRNYAITDDDQRGPKTDNSHQPDSGRAGSGLGPTGYSPAADSPSQPATSRLSGDHLLNTPTLATRTATRARARAPPTLSTSPSSPPPPPSCGHVPRLGSFVTSILHPSTALPPFPAISMSLRLVPTTPRVISPSPTPSDRAQRGQSQDPEESYFGPVTRSVTRRRGGTPQKEDKRPAERKSRARSRSPGESQGRVAIQPMMTVREQDAVQEATASPPVANGDNKAPGANGHLAPPTTPGYWTWRDFSRSPSPLGLIPIHRHWRSFVHQHEVPRKALHVSIGFVALWLYTTGTQPDAVTPWLMAALVPIATADLLRFNWPAFNRLYVGILGALMRETEFSGFNGVIFYLMGAWAVLNYFPKDVGMTGVLLLSWCDTAASTFGRLYGRYTPHIRRGKSLAGSLAAFLVGIVTASLFWGWVVPSTAARIPGNDDAAPIMFQGVLRLPGAVVEYLGVSQDAVTVTGNVALAVMSVWSGLVASASEVVDIFGLDDNLTIPVLSGIGVWGFLKVFG